MLSLGLLFLPLLPSFCLGCGPSKIRVGELLPVNTDVLISMLLYFDLVYTVYHDLRHRKTSHTRIFNAMQARLQQQAQKCDALSELIGHPPVLPWAVRQSLPKLETPGK